MQLSPRQSLVHGFTLIEVLAVIGLLAIVTSMLFVSLRQARENATVAAAAQFSRSIENVLLSDIDAEVIGVWDMISRTGGGAAIDTASGNNMNLQGNSSWDYDDTPIGSGASVKCATDTNTCLFRNGIYLKNKAALEADSSVNTTISTWFKVDSLPATYFVSIAQIGGTNIFMRIFPDGSLRASYSAAGVDVRAQNIKPGQWYHVAFTYNTDNARLYLNGKMVDKDDSVTSTTIGSPHIYIGGGGSYGTGMKIWNPRVFKSTEFTPEG
jgi:prepilin-type N-terminal cleavage/methylation domain-containing protein